MHPNNLRSRHLHRRLQQPLAFVALFTALGLVAGCSGQTASELSDGAPSDTAVNASSPATEATDEAAAVTLDSKPAAPIAGKSDSVTVPTMDVDAFMQAALQGNADAIARGLRQGIDVNAVGEAERTALQLASFDGHTDVVNVLLKNGSKVDQLDASGRTALMYASTGANVETVKALLKADANVHLVDKVEQFNPLMWAAAEGQTEVVRLLLDAGADPTKQDVDGETALDFARDKRHADVIKLLTK